MHANNLSVCIANKGCDKECPYCVSKMTGASRFNEALWERNAEKVLKIASIAGVTSILITGKGEPMLNLKHVQRVCEMFKNFPIELQTNGARLSRTLSLVRDLHDYGVDTIAISTDTIDELFAHEKLYDAIEQEGMTTRVTMNVTDLLPTPSSTLNFATWADSCRPLTYNFDKYIDACLRLGIRQLTFRQITKAAYTPRTSIHDWIEKHAENDYYFEIVRQIHDATKGREPVRYLPYGAVVHDVMGVSVTCFESCVQDSSHDDGIRSLIWDEDGHVYTAWNSKASRLF